MKRAGPCVCKETIERCPSISFSGAVLNECVASPSPPILVSGRRVDQAPWTSTARPSVCSTATISKGRLLSLPTLHLGPAWLHLGWAPFPLADSPSAYVWGKKTPAVSRVQGVNLQRSPQRRPLSNNQNLQSPRPSLVSFIEAAVVVAQEGVKAIAFTVGGSALAPPFRPAEAQRRS